MVDAPTIISPVRGMQYRGPDAWFVVHDLEIGDPLLVEREPENEYDSYAVKVVAPIYTDGLIHIGYIAREKAVTMASFIDKGWVYTSCVYKGCVVKKSAILLNSLVVKCTPIKPTPKKVEKKVHEHV